MFYHRVLPPPSSLRPDATAAPLVAGSRAVRRDTLLDNKIMPGEDPEATVERNHHHRKANRSISLQLDRDDPETRSAGSEEKSPSTPSHGLRSSTRLGRKRAASPGSAGSHRDPKRDQLAVPAQGRGSKSIESPSQVCLCQPDPKVPRPRNGMASMIWVTEQVRGSRKACADRCSVHPLPPASSGGCRSQEPRPRKPGNLEDYRRLLEDGIGRHQDALEATC